MTDESDEQRNRRTNSIIAVAALDCVARQKLLHVQNQVLPSLACCCIYACVWLRTTETIFQLHGYTISENITKFYGYTFWYYTVSQRNVVSTFFNYFTKCLPISKFLSLLERATNYLQNEHNIYRHLLKTSLYYSVKHKNLKKVHLLYQFFTTKLCQTFIISLWIVNRFQKHILRIRSALVLIEQARECLLCECLLCPDCKQTQLGREYMGTLSQTVNSRTCQSWASITPHVPNSASQNDANYPDGSREAAMNYCRNPDSDTVGPWCYTTDPNVRWETCNLPSCGTCIGYSTLSISSNVR